MICELRGQNQGKLGTTRLCAPLGSCRHIIPRPGNTCAAHSGGRKAAAGRRALAAGVGGCTGSGRVGKRASCKKLGAADETVRAHIISNKERAASQLRAHARAVTHAMDPRCISISSCSASLGRLAFGSSKGGHDMLLRLLRVRRRRAGRRRRWRAEHIAPKHAIRIDMLLELAKVVQVISERAN